ncbi:MAG: hypothetical protein GDA36_07540 [Rhodobacteraceae bacterium]|nr:hypothetical protein [Paracoccaceae bacterium]
MRVVLGVGVLALLLVLIAALVLPACGVRFVVGQSLLQFCPVALTAPADQSTTDALLERRRALLAEIQGLERGLGLRSCAPVPPPAPEPIPQQQAETPDGIDTEAWNNQDVTLLEGCWILDGEDYHVSDINDPRKITRFTEWEMCFDAHGQGEQTLYGTHLPTGAAKYCAGNTSAAFDERGHLVLSDAANVQCDNSYIYRRVTTCELIEHGRAQCFTVQPDSPGRGGSDEVRLKRKRTP